MYLKSYQENKIEFLDEIYFNLNLDSNLNIKPDFQVNSRFSTTLCYSPMNRIKIFSTSSHVMMVLIEIHQSHHHVANPNLYPKKHTQMSEDILSDIFACLSTKLLFKYFCNLIFC